MSFTPFSSITLPTLPTIPNPFISSSKKDETSKTFELVKYVTEKEMYNFEYNNSSYRDCLYYIDIGYITSKYFPIKDTGCYIIMIESQISEGPNAIFTLARSDKSKPGIIQTMVSSHGKSNDHLELKWNPMEYPCVLLKHNFSKKHILQDDTKLRFGYNIKVIYM
jgi:hypothetical protein